MTLKCYVVDDEEHASHTIATYIEMTEGLELIGTEGEPLSALKKISEEQLKPDITFLDIDMPRISGIDLAGLIGSYTEIIFITAFPDYAVNAFEQAAIDYVLKPVSYVRFLKAIGRVREKRALSIGGSKEEQSGGYFFIKTNPNGILVKIVIEEIIYAEAKHNYVAIFLKDRSYLAYLMLSEIEEKLPLDKFVRLQKSYIVNIEMVNSIEGNSVTMVTGTAITVGPLYRKMFQALIMEKSLRTKRS